MSPSLRFKSGKSTRPGRKFVPRVFEVRGPMIWLSYVKSFKAHLFDETLIDGARSKCNGMGYTVGVESKWAPLQPGDTKCWRCAKHEKLINSLSGPVGP